MTNLVQLIQKNLIELPKGQASQVSLELSDDLTFEEWQSIGVRLSSVGQARQWWCGDWVNFGAERYERGRYEEALKVLNCAYHTLSHYSFAAGKIESCRRRQHLSFSHHAEVAHMDPVDQDLWLDRAQDGDWTRSELRRQIKLSLKTATPALPDGQYRTIVVDPPWNVDKIKRQAVPEQGAAVDYGVLDINEIQDLQSNGKNITDLMADECHVYLWTTQRYLRASFDIMEGWGLTVVFVMAWHKAGGFQPFGLPQFNCEFVVFGRKGGLGFLSTKDFKCCFDGKRREHSRKPDEFYDMIARVSPEPRLDMFARERRKGFEPWGDETDRYGLCG